MDGNAAFKYTSLERPTDIRLVILEQGFGPAGICCQLVNAGEDQAPSYEALSYEWGSSAEQSEEIFVNGSKFKIRKNLHNALLHLRKDEDRCLWIDALCINQDDISERNHQVNLMGRIYSQAKQVLVWLGLAKDNSDQAMMIFEEMSYFMRSGGLKGPLLQNMGQWIYLRSSGEHNPAAEQPEPELRAVLAWVTRTFWHRIWIVQELQLARKICFHCGMKSISDSALMHAGSYLDIRYPDHLYDPHHVHAELVKKIKGSLALSLLTRRKQGGIDKRKSRLKDWLYMCQNSLCTDPRDKVYALLGIASDFQNGNLSVDYLKSLPEVYMDVLKLYSAQAAGESDMLSFCQFLSKSLISELPYEAIHQIKLDNRSVWLRGVFSGIITRKMGPCRKRYSIGETACRNISGPPAQAPSFSSFPLYDLSISDNKIALLIPGPFGAMIRDVEVDPPSCAIVNPIQTLLDNPNPLSWADRIRMSWGTPEPAGFAHWFTSRPSTYRDDMELYSDASPMKAHHAGYSGFAPTHAEIGDVTCTFPGSNIALVFREAIGCWKLIGRAVIVNPFYISQDQASSMWKGNPNHPLSVSFGSNKAVYLRLELSSLWKLAASHGVEKAAFGSRMTADDWQKTRTLETRDDSAYGTRRYPQNLNAIKQYETFP